MGNKCGNKLFYIRIWRNLYTHLFSNKYRSFFEHITLNFHTFKCAGTYV